MSAIGLSNAVGPAGVTFYRVSQVLRDAAEARGAVDVGFEWVKSFAAPGPGLGMIVDRTA